MNECAVANGSLTVKGPCVVTLLNFRSVKQKRGQFSITIARDGGPPNFAMVSDHLSACMVELAHPIKIERGKKITIKAVRGVHIMALTRPLEGKS